jgi:glycosyltransferase involved in cell wall biosynthesis
MRILVYIEKSMVRGGIEIFAERHVAKLRSEGHDVAVIDDIAALERENAFDGLVVHKCTNVSTLEKFPPEKTTYYVHDHEPICPRGYAYTPLMRNCVRAGGIWPCIVCAPACRSWKAALGRVFSQSRRRRAMAQFKKIVVISEFMKGRLVANGIPPQNIAVEPPTMPTPPAVAAEATPPREGKGVDLLYVGQLIRGKGVHLLLSAMAKMKSRRSLDVVGTGNMEWKLKSLARKLGLEDRVRWHGFQQNPQDWMRAAECVVVPSFWQEPYGLVAAEAVALGKKVVAFAVGGLPEACRGKAVLVPPGDISSLAKALEK